jgi:hypothetical protein
MPPGSNDPLTAYLIERTQSSLRAVVRYDGASYTIGYVREDLSTAGTPDRLYEVLGNIVRGDASDDAMDAEFGELRASVQVREGGLVVHMPTGEDAGVLVSLESDVAAQLDDFVAECSKRI